MGKLCTSLSRSNLSVSEHSKSVFFLNGQKYKKDPTIEIYGMEIYGIEIYGSSDQSDQIGRIFACRVIVFFEHFFLGQRPLVPLLLLLFGSTTLLTGMTGISLHMQWPLTS
jgi:hypothetical protein